MDIDPQKLNDEELDRAIEVLESISIRTPLDYVPHPENPKTGFKGMLGFHQSLKHIRLLSGGNQSGKTTAGVIETLFHATGLYPDWYPKAARFTRPTRGRIVGEDYGKWCGEVLEPKLMEWLPKELIVHIRKTMKGYMEKVSIKHISGGVSTFDIMTHEQDDGVFEGWTGDWVWFDEPPPQEKWVACKRGLIYANGRAIFTMTPIKEPWIYNNFILNKNPDVYYLNIDMRDNPCLTEEAIVTFERDLPEDVKEARLHGKFKHLSGRVYKEFDESIHCVSEDKVKINSNWPVYFVCDPHDRKDHFGIWARVDPFNTLWIIDEIKYKATLKDFSKEVLQRELMAHINPNDVIRIGDPNKMETPSAMNGLKFKEEFAKHGLYFITNVNDDITLGHLAVQGRLMYDKTKPISSTNLPKLFFVKDKVPGMIKSMLMYVWDDFRGSSKDSKGLKESPKDIEKDFPDTLRYLVMSNPAFFGKDDPDPSPVNSTGFTGYRK